MKFDFTKAKQDDRPYISGRGWGSGMYTCICRKCGDSYFGEKRSWECADCAYESKDKVA